MAGRGHGGGIIDWPLGDPDLENLRQHPRFMEVYESLRRNQADVDRP